MNRAIAVCHACAETAAERQDEAARPSRRRGVPAAAVEVKEEAGGSRDRKRQRRQRQEQQQEEEQYVLFGPSMAAQYTPMLLRFEQLDTRRIRCGAVADDAWAAASGHLVALPYGNAVLHVCHAVVSASHPSNHRICVCFPQAGSEGKPEAAGGRGGSAAVQAIALPPPHTWLLLSQHWRPAAAPPVGWVQGGQPALMLCALRLELFYSTGALLLDCHWRVPFHLVQEGSGSAADAGAVHGPPALLARRPAAL